jgi:hypothetical protein
MQIINHMAYAVIYQLDTVNKQQLAQSDNGYLKE